MVIEFGPAFWGLITLGVVGAVIHGLFFLPRAESLPRGLVKTVFMAALTGAFFIAGAPPMLLLALAASAVGDFLLAFKQRWVLPLGILAFLVAQLTYFQIFRALWFFTSDFDPAAPRLIATAAILAFTAGFLIWMTPRLKWFAFAVIPYALAIAAMGCMAMWLPWEAWPAMLGALFFLASDFILAIELFRLTPEASVRRITAPAVWWTYVAAQLLIVWGVMAAALTD